MIKDSTIWKTYDDIYEDDLGWKKEEPKTEDKKETESAEEYFIGCLE